MVTTNYQTFGSKGFNLRFRMYQAGEVRYISVNNLLQGTLFNKHWNQKKQCFIPSAPYSEENNQILREFKTKHDLALMNWEGSLFSYAQGTRNGTPVEEAKTLKMGMDWVIEKAKQSRHADGTYSGTYETYLKVERRLKEYCQARHLKYEKVKLEDIDEIFVNDCLKWLFDTRNGKGQYFSTMFRSALTKLGELGWYDFKKIEHCNWQKRIRNYSRKYQTLSPDQCNKLITLKKEELPRGNGFRSRLYRDFCIFVLFTCQSACDALSLKYSDIKKINGVDHFVFRRRKIETKQAVECVVPINEVMADIMQRWKKISRDGYIFPVRNNETVKKYQTSNMDIKRFIKRCNVWLKKLGDILECDFPLHTYVFRHTAITHYISKGVPIIYVANLAGTSVDNCEKIYYNNQGDDKSRDKVLNALTF